MGLTLSRLPTTVRATVDEEVLTNPRALDMVFDQLARMFGRVTGRDATAFLMRPPDPKAPLNMRYRYEVLATDDPVGFLVALDNGEPVRWRPV